VVISALRAAGLEVDAVYDDDPANWGREVMGVKIVGPIAGIDPLKLRPAVIAVGDNRARKRIAEALSGAEWITVVHPSTCIDPSVRLGSGSVVAACAGIQPEVVIGQHCIVNSMSGVGHECNLSDFVHVAGGATLGGGVHLGEGVLVGLGCLVVPRVSVGCWSVIAAGSVVTKNLRGNVFAAGAPARQIRGLKCE